MAPKYFQNVTNNLIRVSTYTVKPREAFMVPSEEAEAPKFANAIGNLIRNIDKKTYEQIIVENNQSNSVLRKRGLPQVTTFKRNPDPDSIVGMIETTQEVECEPHPKELREYMDRKRQEEMVPLDSDIRPSIDADFFAGADHATGSRPDPAQGGKTLTELQQEKLPERPIPKP